MWNMMRQILIEIDRNWKNIMKLNTSSKSETNLRKNNELEISTTSNSFMLHDICDRRKYNKVKCTWFCTKGLRGFYYFQWVVLTELNLRGAVSRAVSTYWSVCWWWRMHSTRELYIVEPKVAFESRNPLAISGPSTWEKLLACSVRTSGPSALFTNEILGRKISEVEVDFLCLKKFIERNS